MNSTIPSLIRAVMMLIGSYLIGRAVWGVDVTAEMWQTAIGVVLSIASVVWSIMSKTLTEESLESTVRQTVTFIGGIFIAKGKASPESITAWLGFITAVLPVLMSALSKNKNEKIQKGTIQPRQLTTNKKP